MYDRETYAHVSSLVGHQGPVNCLAMNPDASLEQMISVSSDGFFVVWDLNTAQELYRGAGDGRGLACVAWKVGPVTFILLIYLQS